MARRPDPTDPLWKAILEEAAMVRPEDADLDLEDPALVGLVDRAVAPFAPALTPKGIDEARKIATAALATHPDIDALLDDVRDPKADGSGVRIKQSPARLTEAAEQHRQRGRRAK